VVHGDFTMLLPDDEQVYAFTRRHGDVELLVLVNVSGAEASVEAPDLADWSRSDLLLGTVDGPGGHAWPVLLGPWEARVHRRHLGGR
jgi:oligo-1,6-glucosidase